MKTIAQELNIKNFPFEIKDSNGNYIYYEDSTGFWFKCEFDTNGNKTRYEDSTGSWNKREFNSNGIGVYYGNSNGEIVDNRSKEIELTLDDIAKKFNVNVKDLKVKK